MASPLALFQRRDALLLSAWCSKRSLFENSNPHQLSYFSVNTNSEPTNKDIVCGQLPGARCSRTAKRFSNTMPLCSATKLNRRRMPLKRVSLAAVAVRTKSKRSDCN